MKRLSIRCYKGFAALPAKFNIEVFYTIPDMGYSRKLFTCINCGEIFVIDFENPRLARKSPEQIAKDSSCPKCGKLLNETIRPYPQNFLTDDGEIGQFKPDHIIPPDSESLVKEFWEIN